MLAGNSLPTLLLWPSHSRGRTARARSTVADLAEGVVSKAVGLTVSAGGASELYTNRDAPEEVSTRNNCRNIVANPTLGSRGANIVSAEEPELLCVVPTPTPSLSGGGQRTVVFDYNICTAGDDPIENQTAADSDRRELIRGDADSEQPEFGV
jgi:hypothetical protein